MRTFSFTFIMLLVATFLISTGCTKGNQGGMDSTATDTTDVDTLVDSLSQIVEEEPMPAAADELFDDFFFNFAASRKVQKERILFPITETSFGKTRKIEKKAWKMEHFFMRQGYYTLIFSKKSQLNVMKDTSINEVTVGKISFSRNTVKRWHFMRERGLWHLHDIALIPLVQHPDHAFLSFYHRFATDEDFQQESLASSISFTGPDPDDDFGTMTGEVLPEQWPMFAPWMPQADIYNIIYGTPVSPKSSTRYFLIRGIANGLQTDITFIKQGGKWILKKITT